MIIDRIVVENFGVFAGVQQVELTPPSADKPITLFGGLNGEGKTTLLDAMQLALYGKLAQTSNRGSIAYDVYLRKCAHRHASDDARSAVRIDFRYTSDGVESRYSVERSWSTNGTVKETLNVSKDGVPDTELADRWDEYFTEIMPISISQLYLFDGERVAELAEPRNSTRILRTAVQSLLGLDIVDQLSTDLLTLEMRKRKEVGSDEERRQIEEAQQSIDQAKALRDALEEQTSQSRDELAEAREHRSSVEREFELSGGHLYEERESLETGQRENKEAIAACNDALRELATGPLPLLMILEQADAVVEQARLESAALRDEITLQLLLERDKAALEALANASADERVLQEMGKFFESDAQRRMSSAQTPRYLELSEAQRTAVEALATHELPRVRQEARDLIAKHQKLTRDGEALERKLAGLPTEDSLEDILTERAEARRSVERADAKLHVLGDQLEKAESELESRSQALVALIESAVGRDFQQEDAGRLVTHASLVREALESFREMMVEHHARRIERSILECFRQLLRKDRLIAEMKLHTEDSSLELIGPGGDTFDTDRLSAGESQLLAVAILWGLARASGRVLPVAIDTPLSRLDSTYRDNLVSLYFPRASHQVLLLSTNKEIDREALAELEPAIGHMYRLKYDEKSDGSQITEGYFW